MLISKILMVRIPLISIKIPAVSLLADIASDIEL